MREILFKAKRIDNGEWVEGYVFETNDNSYIAYNGQFDDDLFLSPQNIFIPIDANTICQYTGLTDKNGNMIWENDVVKGKYWERGNSHRHIGEIKYIGNAFKVVGVKQYRGYHDELNGSYEIIGNIFDNPELLEGGAV